MKLCCIFNYAPDYRRSIYEKIDNTFDTQFFFGREVEENKKSGIPKIDYSLFNIKPIEIKNKVFLRNHISWRTGIQLLPFKEYDVFLITGDLPYSYFPFLLNCRLRGKKVFAWGHGFKEFSTRYGLLAKLFIRLLTGFFVYGNLGRERMIELGIPSEKLTTIYNSLDGRTKLCKLDSPVYKEIFKNDFPTLIFIGRLTAVKKLDWIINALADLNKDGFKCNLMLIGDGPEKDTLKNLCATLNIYDHVCFYGECHEENKIAPLIYNADLCVSPGNVGLTALNSMRFGTPVLSHDDFESQMPEYETIIPGMTGDLYKAGDYDDFKNKIKRWLTLNKDRNTIRHQCEDMINEYWNSDYQIELIGKVLQFGTD